MKTVFKSILSVFFSLYLVFLFSGCNNDNAESDVTTAPSKATEVTTQAVTFPDSTDDESNDTPSVNYNKLLRSADSVESTFNDILVNNKYRGTVYFKIGNDFEYIGSNGFSDMDTRRKNSVNTVYYTGSVTKQLTAAAIMLLQEDGKLSTSDTLDKYYPDYKYGDTITIKNLLTMTAGLPDYINKNNSDIKSSDYAESELPYKISQKNTASANHKAILNWILSQKVQSKAGQEFAYSNSEYFILGDIIEQASGISYEDYIYENILEPVNMKNSGFEAPDSLAIGYQEIYDNDWTLYPGVAYSALGLVSDTNDILKWIDAITGDTLLSAESKEEMFTPYKSDFAYGVYADSYGGYYIDGYIYRFNSTVYYDANKSNILIAMSNYTLSTASKLKDDFEETLLPYIEY